MALEAVIFDLGGVVFPSPMDAFDAYNASAGLPHGFVRDVIRESSEVGAWAAHERGELPMSAFLAALESESEAKGHRIDAAELMAQVGSAFGPRPEMVAAIGTIRDAGFRTAALTNNWRAEPGEGVDAALARDELFDVVVESAVEGVRKPEPAIYELVLARLGLPAEACAFLDDLGVNLKPARALGMTTIKVADPSEALAQLGAVLGLRLV